MKIVITPKAAIFKVPYPKDKNGSLLLRLRCLFVRQTKYLRGLPSNKREYLIKRHLLRTAVT